SDTATRIDEADGAATWSLLALSRHQLYPLSCRLIADLAGRVGNDVDDPKRTFPTARFPSASPDQRKMQAYPPCQNAFGASRSFVILNERNDSTRSTVMASGSNNACHNLHKADSQSFLRVFFRRIKVRDAM